MMNLRNYTLRELLVNCDKKRTVFLRNKWDSRKHNPFAFRVFSQLHVIVSMRRILHTMNPCICGETFAAMRL